MLNKNNNKSSWSGNKTLDKGQYERLFALKKCREEEFKALCEIEIDNPKWAILDITKPLTEMGRIERKILAKFMGKVAWVVNKFGPVHRQYNEEIRQYAV